MPNHSLFAMRLSAAITDSGWTLDRISNRLHQAGAGCSVSTLSHWQRGLTRPSRGSAPVVANLEDMLGLPSGYLLGLIGIQAPGESGHRVALPDAVSSETRALDHFSRTLGMPADDALLHLQAHDVIFLDAQHRFERQLTRFWLRSLADAVERLTVNAYAAQSPDGSPGFQREIVTLAGCRLGRVSRQAALGLTLAELILDRPLARNETTLVEYQTVSVPEPEPSTDGWDWAEWRLTRATGRQVSEIRFPLGQRPAAVELVVVPDLAGDASMVNAPGRPLVVFGGCTQATVAPQGPVGMLMRWRWS